MLVNKIVSKNEVLWLWARVGLSN